MHIAEAAQEYDIEDNHDHDILSCKIPSIMSLLVKNRRGPRDGYGNDSYNMDDIVMPLHEYINHPIAMDIVHNGATFRKRLDDMLYVGITEDHRESATMFGNVVGAQVIAQLMASIVNNDTSAFLDAVLQYLIPPMIMISSSIVETKSKNMTVGKLMKTYGTCISELRTSQSKTRTASLKRISPANFTKEYTFRHIEMYLILSSLLKEIISLNNLDMELYKYANEIFQKQHGIMEQRLHDSDSVTPEK
ncbi:hypothetical protein LXL04_038579 [Taraxacum kok-saghyz]